ncbi:ubiquitin carboxyl-terminal hydrolase 16 [Pantherophis guttatus]|uniref:Ubiquitin carboxyl-terminal hydrolase n=1 Tax=Pantherophis guttatus TaxID=94885 RepID=A0A6P9CYK0_PANGU|nr:ubiquitin carboxyl-terminal hydrolase 16 [Pantherophis guttatus]XP_060542363.1 ubiquitin carboxyl-terminal hydrolase 16 [Pantherophis guttatus]
MGKKRTKGKNIPADVSPDVLGPTCKHLRKGLEQGLLKKVLQTVDLNSCQDCQIDDNKTDEKSDRSAEDKPSIWLCLKCGHRGCGRNCQEQHALKHYETPRSEPHCLVLNVENWCVWCYLCDDEIEYNSSNRLGQLVDFIRKQTCVNIPNTATKNEEKPLENKKIKDHKNEEEKEKKEILFKDNKNQLNGNSEMTVKGLSNLGNTCFFNAVLQNLSQTSVLRELLKEVKMPDSTITLKPPEFSITEPLVVILDPPRPLTLAMCQFLAEMQETKKGSVTPRELFSQICKKATRFKGYQQQDSQELLRYLLDGMRTEEIQRTSAAIFKALNNSDKENEQLKKEVKEYEKKKVMHSFVDRIFGGELTSTIMCEECQTVSLVHEPFLDLSLPVLNDQNGKKNNVKKLQEKEIDICEENIENECYVKERDEIPVTSKHLQKKTKKMARKQAKNQRHQQKFQEKVIHLTDNDVAEKTEADHDCNKQTIESNSDIRCLKPEEEESLNTCEEHCVDKKCVDEPESIVQVPITEKHDENADSCDQEANNEVNLDVSIKEFVPATECVNKFDDLHLKEDKDEEDDDIISDFSKLFLEEEEPSDDTDSLHEFYGFETQTYEVVNEDPETAFCSLADSNTINIEENSILHCLNQFTRIEKLCENNKLLCEVCTRNQLCGIKTNKINSKKYVYTNAKKQMLISLAPPILTLHLKRFQQAGYNLQKVNKHISFPEVMDLAPFCSIKCKNAREGTSEVLYSLYGIVEHSGTMRSGHYTAYVKTSTTSQLSDLVNDKIQPTSESESPRRQWFHVSDTHVQAVSISKVLKSQAYLLFYERIL